MSGIPVWPRIPPAFVRAMLAGHSALGLAFAALIWLVCFTGSVAVFTQEFQRWEDPVAPLSGPIAPDTVNKAFHAGMAKMPWAHDAYVTLPDAQQPRLLITGSDYEHGERSESWLANARGELTRQVDFRWAEFQAQLHFELHIPRPWGGYLIGLVGVALLSSIISGILSHPRAFKDAFSLRLGGAKRLQEADLHNRMGVWGLPFYLVVSLTGAFLGLTTLIVGILALAVFKGDVSQAYALFLGPSPAENEAHASPPDLTKMYAYVKANAPQAEVNYIMMEHPFEKGGKTALNAKSPGKISRGENYIFDADAKYIGVMGYEKGVLGQKILSGTSPLHFGWFGGAPVKVIYGVLGMFLASITSSGVMIWMARRRDKGKPAEAWERLWIAFVWSQPLAYAATAGTVLLTPASTPESLLIGVWGAITGASLLLPVVLRPKPISAALRCLGGAAMLVLAGIHAWRFGVVTVDLTASILNGWIAVLGLALIVSVIWTPHLKAAKV